MDERLQFVARRLAGEPMADLCREFGISRTTGYKIFDRYQECGVEGLTDRSRRPHHYAHKLPFQVENYILNVKHESASWQSTEEGCGRSGSPCYKNGKGSSMITVQQFSNGPLYALGAAAPNPW